MIAFPPVHPRKQIKCVQPHKDMQTHHSFKTQDQYLNKISTLPHESHRLKTLMSLQDSITGLCKINQIQYMYETHLEHCHRNKNRRTHHPNSQSSALVPITSKNYLQMCAINIQSTE